MKETDDFVFDVWLAVSAVRQGDSSSLDAFLSRLAKYPARAVAARLLACLGSTLDELDEEETIDREGIYAVTGAF